MIKNIACVFLLCFLFCSSLAYSVGFQAEITWRSNKDGRYYDSLVEACAWQLNPNVYMNIRAGACLESQCDCINDFKLYGTVYHDINLQNQVTRSNTCPPGFYVTTSGYPGQCSGEPQADGVCEEGYDYDAQSGLCVARCGLEQEWDGTQCKDKETENDNCSTTGHPIDLIEGEKYRSENVLSIGEKDPINLRFFYRSHIGLERSGQGMAAGVGHINNGAYFVADSKLPMTPQLTATYFNDYQDILYDRRPYSGGYWTHSYDHRVYLKNNKLVWVRPDRKEVYFDSEGHSKVYTSLISQALPDGGWRVYDRSTRQGYKFDSSGRLQQLTDLLGKPTLLFSYKPAHFNFTKIENSQGHWVEIQYDEFPVNPTTVSSIIGDYSVFLPVKFVDSAGRTVDIAWSHMYTGRMQKFPMISRISYPYAETPGGFREYQYNNDVFKNLLTDIVDYPDGVMENAKVYAHFEYDARGRAVYSGLANGVEAVTVDYVDDLTRTITNALGKRATYTFTSENGVRRLAKIVGEPTLTCARSDTEYTYNSDGTRATKTTNGVTTSYGYNTDRQRILVTEAAGTSDSRSIITEWHPSLNTPTKISEAEKSTRYEYSDTTALLMAAHIEADGTARSTTYTYYDNGLVHTVDGPRTDLNDLTTYLYDNQHNLTSITNAASQTTLFGEYNGLGLVQTVTDANGVVTQYSYDLQGRITRSTIKHPSGNSQFDVVTIYEYDPIGNLVSMTFADGSRLEYQYDSANRVKGIRNNMGERIELAHDASSNVLEKVVKDSGGNITFQEGRAYDELSRVIRQVGAAGQETLFSYDGSDNLTQTTDGRKEVTEFEYDNLSRVTKILEPLGVVTQKAYDPADQLVSVTDAENLPTQYTYNGFGELIKQVSPDTGTTLFAYDSAGNLARKVDARGVVALYSYDSLNRLTGIEFPADSSKNITYQYDDTVDGNYGVGRLTAIIDGSGITQYAYNFLGNLVSKRSTIGNTLFTTEYRYDVFGRLQTQVYPSGRLVHYGYDALSRIGSITTQANDTATVQNILTGVAYLPFGPAKFWTYGNGIVHALTFDQDYRVTHIEGSDQVPLYHLGYSYDNNSNIQTLDNLVNSLAAQVFSYDPLNRLDTAEGIYGVVEYDYDKVGSRTEKRHTQNLDVAIELYSYKPNSHQLEQVSDGTVSSRSFSYDANGNPLTDSQAGGLVWEYDNNNRPQSVTVNGDRIDYRHNALGQRVFKQRGGSGLFYIYDESGHLLAVSDEQGRYLEEHLWFDNTLVASILQKTAETDEESDEIQASNMIDIADNSVETK